VVVVTFNYRMGVFGGFGLPGLEGSGTFGLLDQRAALDRVRRNAFTLVDVPAGAEHSADIEYLFPDDADQGGLSDRMIDYWTAFARTGDANTADLPTCGDST
jgi:carboxylesterase type B